MTDAVALTSPDKLLWPEAGLTKADLLGYYQRAADRLLPYLRDRPLTLKRFPSGVHQQGFFQKHVGDDAPAHVRRHPSWSESSDRTVEYALIDDVEGLGWLAQVAAVELHPWFSRVDRPDRNDVLVFDLDPADEEQSAAQAAWWLREVLDEVGLEAAPKTSGKRGLHLYVPVERRYTFDDLRGFGLAVARACAARHPDVLTVEMRKADRRGRLLLDWSRNGASQTLVAPWSPRAHPAATVSMPLRWEEVTDDLDPTDFTLRTAMQRRDPWAGGPRPQRIESARKTLAEAGFPSVDRSPRARTTP